MDWKLYEGDCFDYFHLIEDKSIDMILCDLPYGTTQNKWDSVLDLDLLWREYKRVIKSNGTIALTAQTPFDKVLGCSNLPLLKYEWIWEKEQGTGYLNSKKMPLKIHENVLIFYNNLPVYNPQMKGTSKRNISRSGDFANTSNYGIHKNPKTSVYNGRSPTTILKIKRDKLLHPTQKPVKLFEYLIKTYTNEQDLVLDNCAGSGTTGVACYNTNRDCVMMEKEPEYCEIIKDRMREVTSQEKLL
jgi:site-specific DNA-methyltransferase (adenine-specific)